MKLRHYLKKHPNTIILRISKIEMEYTMNGVMKLYKFTLSESIKEVTSSIKYAGDLIIVKDISEVWLTEENVDKVKAFTVGNYGNMKMKLVNLFLDVSKPLIRKIGDDWVNVRPSRVWITPIPFASYSARAGRLSVNTSIINRMTGK